MNRALPPLQAMTRTLTAKARPRSRTAALLRLLDCNGPMSTADLAAAIDGTRSNVWGLLKDPRERGQVLHAQGLWALNRDYQAVLEQAAALLRSHGWRVLPPALPGGEGFD